MPVVINDSVCNGCNSCVEACPMDIIRPNPEKGKPPIIEYPDECGCITTGMGANYLAMCCMDCPLYEKGAISIYVPWYLRRRIKRG